MNKNKRLLRYLSDNERYADLINGYSGATILHAEDLSEADSMSGAFPNYGGERGRQRSKERYRDLIRKSAFGLNFAIIGIENQSEVHYLMSLRTMSYDVAEYEKQAYLIRKEVSKMKGISSSEFLSGFLKTSKLHPCITFVLYWGDNWDGAHDLHGILDFENIPPELRKFVNNYPLHIINIREFTNTDVFQTDLKQVFDFIRYSKDKEKLKQLVKKDPAYRQIDKDAFDVIAAFTNTDELVYEPTKYGKGGKVDMCQAIKELIQDGREEGIAIGREEGISIGREEQIMELIQKKLAKGKSILMIADELEEPVGVIERLMNKQD